VRVALLFVGFGNVAQRFVTLLDESRDTLARYDIEPVIVGAVTRQHGTMFAAAGAPAGWTLDPSARLTALEAISRLGDVSTDAKVVVETTTLDIAAGEPAISHVRAGFAAGAHVITANKGPVAFAYDSLCHAAESARLSFLFEGAVMDGIPVFNLVRQALPGVSIRGFRGVVNSTTNHILTAMERGETFSSALSRMQAAGVAEADPSLDVDGWDAAAKTAALANVWLDAAITPRDVTREGIGPETMARVQGAMAKHRRLKVVASGARIGDGVDARVALEELDTGDPLAALDGQGNALEIDTWPTGRIVITQRDGGLEKTAYALLADLIEIRNRLR
jgi:homoserine dehydrogenase